MANEYKSFWMQFFKGLDAPGISGEIMVPSIFRTETTPSMSINVDTGFWKDFGDEAIGAKKKKDSDEMSNGGGDAIRFIETLYEVSYSVAKTATDEIMAGKEPMMPIPHDYIMELHNNLMNNAEMLNQFITKRGVTVETVQHFLIGWDSKLKRITLPVMGAYGYWVNIRKYSMTDKGKMKMINHSKKAISGKKDDSAGGYGQARLFPIRNLLKSQIVVIFEGEWDALLADSMGIRAITSTGGSSVFPKDSEDWFYGKTVYLCYDNDEQGRAGMLKVARRLHGIAEKILMCPPVPLDEPANADFTDFILSGFTRDDFATLVLREAVVYDPKNEQEEGKEQETSEYEAISLAQSLDPGYQNMQVSVNSLVVGKGKTPYTIEKKIQITCTKMNGDSNKCQSCGVFEKDGKSTIILDPKDSETLQFIKVQTYQKQGAVKQKAKIPRSCDLYDSVVEQWQNVEELLISPQVQTAKAPGAVSGDTHFHQTAFHIYPTKTTRIDTNRTYQMNSIRTTDPWQQASTFLIQEATPLQSNIEVFKLTDELKEQLKVFQVSEGQTIKEKFDEIHADLEYNITRIFGRRDLMVIYDLVFHSALRFVFQSKVEHKGWLECLVIGDTRTGKSETAQWMAYHYRAGEYGSGEGTSIAGLLGGLQQGSGGNNWMLTWGKIPLNDRGLFVIDEVSGLPIEHIGQLSGIRSMGIAELTKIRQEKTNARTRLIWISNPRKGKSLNDFEYGCEAIQELIGANEDIARFDVAITAASGEVPEEEINMHIDQRKPVPHVYTTDLCNALILWSWSRNLGNIEKNNQVEFSREAEEVVLGYATKFGRTFSSKIPLVEGANQRIKIAKMAVAVAMRVFSTDEACEKVIVKPEHVVFAAETMWDAYHKSSMAYSSFSAKMHDESTMDDKSQAAVKQYLLAYSELLDGFKIMKVFSFTQIQQLTGYDPDVLREHIHWLADRKMIRIKGNGLWALTNNGIALLKHIRR